MILEELQSAIDKKKTLIADIKNKIENLKASQGKERPEGKTEDDIQELQYRSAATSLMEKDPTKAMELLNKADALREKKKENDPETIRFKIASNLNTVNGLLQKMDPADPERKWNVTLKTELEKQLGSDSPSLQLAYTNAVAEYNKAPSVKEEPPPASPSPPASPTPAVTTGSPFSNYNDAISTINSELGKIKTQGPRLTDAIKLLRQRVNASDLTIDKTKRDMLLGELDTQEKNKPKAPVKIDIKAKVNELTQSKNNSTTAKASEAYNKAIGAYQSAKAAYESKNWGTAIGNFLYSLRPEAVNDGDIEIAANGSATITEKGIGALSKKFGVDVTNLEKIATLQGESAYRALSTKRIAGINLFELWLDKNAKGSEATSYIKSLFPAPSPLSGSTMPPTEDTSKLAAWNNKLTDTQKRKIYKIGQKVKVGSNAFTVYEKADKTLGIK